MWVTIELPIFLESQCCFSNPSTVILIPTIHKILWVTIAFSIFIESTSFFPNPWLLIYHSDHLLYFMSDYCSINIFRSPMFFFYPNLSPVISLSDHQLNFVSDYCIINLFRIAKLFSKSTSCYFSLLPHFASNHCIINLLRIPMFFPTPSPVISHSEHPLYFFSDHCIINLLRIAMFSSKSMSSYFSCRPSITFCEWLLHYHFF